MKKIIFSISLLVATTSVFAQKTILVNGGQFGNSSEMANVIIYDAQKDTSIVIDTIRTNSVQDILIVDSMAYVAAQDSIVLYNLDTEKRKAAAKFNGLSTKTMAIYKDELLVGNWYAKDSANLSFYNKNTLSYIDTLDGVSKGAKSILINNGFAYIPQNSQTSSFTDTLGSIIKVDIANRSITDTITVANYTFEFGELVENPNGLGFYSINSGSNTITSIDYATLTPTNTSFSQNLRVGNQSQLSVFNDTLFLKMSDGIGAINLQNLALIDSAIVDTIVTAFTYDTTSLVFYVTQTNFSSFIAGKIYSRSGVKIDTFKVGFSPEVIRMYYDQTLTSIADYSIQTLKFDVYPNPSTEFFKISGLENNNQNQLMIFNQNGQLIMGKNNIKNQENISVADLAKGVYFIRFSSVEKYGAKKLIVQ